MTDEDASPITAEQVIRFARSLGDQRLTTQARGVAFSAAPWGSGLIYTLAETGRTRPEPASALEKVVARFGDSRSLRPADYQDLTFNASYTLALLGYVVAARRRT